MYNAAIGRQALAIAGLAEAALVAHAVTVRP